MASRPSPTPQGGEPHKRRAATEVPQPYVASSGAAAAFAVPDPRDALATEQWRAVTGHATGSAPSDEGQLEACETDAMALVARLKRRGAPQKFHGVMPGSLSTVVSPRPHEIRSAARLEAALSNETLPLPADDLASLSTSLTGSIEGAVEVAPAASPHAPPGQNKGPRRAGAMLNRERAPSQNKGVDSLRWGGRSFASAAALAGEGASRAAAAEAEAANEATASAETAGFPTLDYVNMTSLRPEQ